MYDAARARTSEWRSLDRKPKMGISIAMTPSEEWLSDPQRAYPVTIDPHIEKNHQLRQCEGYHGFL